MLFIPQQTFGNKKTSRRSFDVLFSVLVVLVLVSITTIFTTQLVDASTNVITPIVPESSRFNTQQQAIGADLSINSNGECVVVLESAAAGSWYYFRCAYQLDPTVTDLSEMSSNMITCGIQSWNFTDPDGDGNENPDDGPMVIVLPVTSGAQLGRFTVRTSLTHIGDLRVTCGPTTTYSTAYPATPYLYQFSDSAFTTITQSISSPNPIVPLWNFKVDPVMITARSHDATRNAIRITGLTIVTNGMQIAFQSTAKIQLGNPTYALGGPCANVFIASFSTVVNDNGWEFTMRIWESSSTITWAKCDYIDIIYTPTQVQTQSRFIIGFINLDKPIAPSGWLEHNYQYTQYISLLTPGAYATYPYLSIGRYTANAAAGETSTKLQDVLYQTITKNVGLLTAQIPLDVTTFLPPDRWVKRIDLYTRPSQQQFIEAIVLPFGQQNWANYEKTIAFTEWNWMFNTTSTTALHPQLNAASDGMSPISYFVKTIGSATQGVTNGYRVDGYPKKIDFIVLFNGFSRYRVATSTPYAYSKSRNQPFERITLSITHANTPTNGGGDEETDFYHYSNSISRLLPLPIAPGALDSTVSIISKQDSRENRYTTLKYSSVGLWHIKNELVIEISKFPTIFQLNSNDITFLDQATGMIMKPELYKLCYINNLNVDGSCKELTNFLPTVVNVALYTRTPGDPSTNYYRINIKLVEVVDSSTGVGFQMQSQQEEEEEENNNNGNNNNNNNNNMQVQGVIIDDIDWVPVYPVSGDYIINDFVLNFNIQGLYPRCPWDDNNDQQSIQVLVLDTPTRAAIDTDVQKDTYIDHNLILLPMQVLNNCPIYNIENVDGDDDDDDDKKLISIIQSSPTYYPSTINYKMTPAEILFDLNLSQLFYAWVITNEKILFSGLSTSENLLPFFSVQLNTTSPFMNVPATTYGLEWKTGLNGDVVNVDGWEMKIELTCVSSIIVPIIIAASEINVTSDSDHININLANDNFINLHSSMIKACNDGNDNGTTELADVVDDIKFTLQLPLHYNATLIPNGNANPSATVWTQMQLVSENTRWTESQALQLQYNTIFPITIATTPTIPKSAKDFAFVNSRQFIINITPPNNIDLCHSRLTISFQRQYEKLDINTNKPLPPTSFHQDLDVLLNLVVPGNDVPLTSTVNYTIQGASFVIELSNYHASFIVDYGLISFYDMQTLVQAQDNTEIIPPALKINQTPLRVELKYNTIIDQLTDEVRYTLTFNISTLPIELIQNTWENVIAKIGLYQNAYSNTTSLFDFYTPAFGINPPPCTIPCGINGICDSTTKQCICKESWYGPQCDQQCTTTTTNNNNNDCQICTTQTTTLHNWGPQCDIKPTINNLQYWPTSISSTTPPTPQQQPTDGKWLMSTTEDNSKITFNMYYIGSPYNIITLTAYSTTSFAPFNNVLIASLPIQNLTLITPQQLALSSSSSSSSSSSTTTSRFVDDEGQPIKDNDDIINNIQSNIGILSFTYDLRDLGIYTALDNVSFIATIAGTNITSSSNSPTTNTTTTTISTLPRCLAPSTDDNGITTTIDQCQNGGICNIKTGRCQCDKRTIWQSGDLCEKSICPSLQCVNENTIPIEFPITTTTPATTYTDICDIVMTTPATTNTSAIYTPKCNCDNTKWTGGRCEEPITCSTQLPLSVCGINDGTPQFIVDDNEEEQRCDCICKPYRRSTPGSIRKCTQCTLQCKNGTPLGTTCQACRCYNDISRALSYFGTDCGCVGISIRSQMSITAPVFEVIRTSRNYLNNLLKKDESSGSGELRLAQNNGNILSLLTTPTTSIDGDDEEQYNIVNQFKLFMTSLFVALLQDYRDILIKNGMNVDTLYTPIDPNAQAKQYMINPQRVYDIATLRQFDVGSTKKTDNDNKDDDSYYVDYTILIIPDECYDGKKTIVNDTLWAETLTNLQSVGNFLSQTTTSGDNKGDDNNQDNNNTLVVEIVDPECLGLTCKAKSDDNEAFNMNNNKNNMMIYITMLSILLYIIF